MPVKFEIFDDFSGAPGHKIVKISSESAPKVYTLSLNMDPKKNPRIFQTQVEKLTRASRLKKQSEKPLNLV